MSDPIVTWRTQDGTQDLKQIAGGEDQVAWNIGTVRSNSESNSFYCTIWNNYGDANNDVSDMNECMITTVDVNGGSNSPVVTGKWIYVRVNSEPNWHQIGGNAENDGWKIQAVGQPVGSGIIKGTRNNGNKTESTSNYAELELKASLGLNVPAGIHLFKLRVSYVFT